MKSKTSKRSSRSNYKIPKSKTYNYENYDSNEGDYEQEQDSVNYSGSLNSTSFRNSLKTQSCSNLFTNPLIVDQFINLAPFPIFKGTNEECPFRHISRFSKVCRANNVFSTESMIRIFPITLEDEASLWLDLNVEPYPFLSWEEIKISFLEAYQKNNYDEELRSIKQEDNESVRSYFLRLQWLMKIWPDHGLTEDSVIRVFVDGLKDEFRDWIVGKRPDSIHDALSLAFDGEKLKNVGKSGEDCEIRGKLRGLEGEKKSQCQCSKHQCGGKKRTERSDSVATAKSVNFS